MALLELALGWRRSLGTQTHSGGVGAQPQRQLAIRQHRATNSQATRNPQARCPNGLMLPHGRWAAGPRAASTSRRPRAQAALALARLLLSTSPPPLSRARAISEPAPFGSPSFATGGSAGPSQRPAGVSASSAYYGGVSTGASAHGATLVRLLRHVFSELNRDACSMVPGSISFCVFTAL